MSERAARTIQNLPSIQVISRAAEIMRALSTARGGMSLSAIAQEVDLPRSTVQRIVAALEHEQLVEFLGSSAGFRLGPALGQLIHQTQSDIISSVRPILADLSARVRETVSLGTLAGDQVYIVDCVTFERELRVVVPIGIQVSAYRTAVGKVLLRGLPVERLAALLPARVPVSDTADLPRAEFMALLARSSEDAQMFDDEEHLEGVREYATLIRTHFGNYAVTILSPTSRGVARAELLQAALMECRDIIEAKVGLVS
jgi:DNA-binding IclR family transcriptional regulator